MKVLLRTQSDARLVALARAGHDRAYEAIVERYRRPLLRACRRILPEARAEDALQQALMAAWTALRRGDEVLELRPWLYRIVRNTALNQLRVAGYDLDELVDTLAAADDPEEEIERRALVRQTLMAVAALPDRQRDALLRTAIEGRGQDEVARDLGLSNTALRQLVHRARTSVRAAATAVVPLPLAAWLATVAPRAEPMTARIVELAAGSGAGATLAKAGTVVVLAGGAVSGPALVDDGAAGERPERRAEAPKAAAVAAVPVRIEAAPSPELRPTVVADDGDGGDRSETGDRGARRRSADDERSGDRGVRILGDEDEWRARDRGEGDDRGGADDHDDDTRDRRREWSDERDGDFDGVPHDDSSGEGQPEESFGGDGHAEPSGDESWAREDEAHDSPDDDGH
jgi:RNA polymerase sigma factor (sigma-70 family)